LKSHRSRRTTAVLLAVLASAACAGARTGAETTPSPADGTALSTAELEALYLARADSATMRVSEADVSFMAGMIGHHAQALEMAGLAPTREASRSVQILTARTINAQQDEINVMSQWLRDRGQTVPDLYTGPGSRAPAPAAGMMMPGMLSAEQMQSLYAASGTDYDRLFLTLMIQHHGGAVTMVHELFATDGAGLDDTVFKVANDIQVDQLTEMARMRRMLEELPDTGRSP
jgi:uncharacterized protein (DUF305 family)